ncbi:substrate-binding domain-containing protein [Oscillospiraceae bacterium 38-13]
MEALKRASALLLAAFLLFMLLDASGRDVNKDGEWKDSPLVGIAMCSLLTERWYKDQEALTAELGRLGADVIVQNANNQQDVQNQQIRSLVEKGVDVLIVIPVNSIGCAAAVQAAKNEGVKVISYERMILKTDIDLYISFDNVNLGRQMGRGLLANMDEGNILLINGDAGDQNSELYRQGYMEVLQEGLDQGDFHVIREVFSENWTKETAYEVVETLLEEGHYLHGIIAENDSLAEMAIQALAERGRAGETVVVGQDGDLGAYQRIVLGVQAATVYKDYEVLAHKAALAAYRLANERNIFSCGTISNGEHEIPYYYLETTLITRENIQEEIIDKQIYRQEEVYRNIGQFYR